jgi:hypothetical protein
MGKHLCVKKVPILAGWRDYIMDYNNRHMCLKLVASFIIISNLIHLAYSLDCNTLKFDNDSDFLYFDGDLYPLDGSMEIVNSTPEHPATVYISSALIEESCRTLNFRWSIDNPRFFNLFIYIDGIPYLCSENPFYKKISSSNGKSHNLKWVLEHNGKVHIGITKANAFIDDFKFCGSHFEEQNSSSISSIEIHPHIIPLSGSLNDTYVYSINRKGIPESSELILEIKDPQMNTWKPFCKGKLNWDNITFVVPDLSFIKPVFFGDIEYRITTNKDVSIYSSKGPHINVNFKEVLANKNLGTISAKVITNMCEQNINLTIHNKTFTETYTGCGNWQKLTFGPIDNLKDEDLYTLGVYNE